MGVLDVLRVNEIKSENSELKSKVSALNSRLDAIGAKDYEEVQNKIQILQTELDAKNEELDHVNSELSQKRDELIVVSEEQQLQEVGLYKPQFDFASALDYSEELAKIRQKQKTMIKDDTAVRGAINWEVNGNKAKGKKMINDMKKLLLRAFNLECDEAVRKVRYTNFEASVDRIYKSAETISKLGTVMNISITDKYREAKLKEIRLAFEYQQKKQEEKENAKAAREEQREQAKVEREIEIEKRKIEKEQSHYQTAFEKINRQLAAAPDDPDLIAKKNQLENELSSIDRALADIDYRQANMKAGYVYVISNIGAFGKDIYKIGMTRRLNPQDRIDELSSASVPFKFDVHMMLFSDNAPALEAALHKAFEKNKVNMVNQRKEFFHVSLDDIKKVVRENYDKTVEFIDVPDAEQYRISQTLRGDSLEQLEHEASNSISDSKTNHTANLNSPNQQSKASQLLYTKWGTYEMPSDYKVKITYGPRTDCR